MTALQDFRAQYPMYDDMSDQQLADALYTRHYSDMPRADFDAKVGFTPGKSKAMQDRDNYYSSGIYAGDWNPMGPIAKSLDAGASAIQRLPLLGWDDEAKAAVATAGGLTDDFEGAREDAVAQRQAQIEQNPTATAVGNIAGALAVGGHAPSFAGSAINAGQSLGRVALSSGLDGATMGAIAGAGDADPGERLENGGYGALGGLALGVGAPIAVNAVGAAARKTLSPFLSSPERTAAADYLAGEGVNLTAGQRTGSKPLRYAESELGGQRAEDLMERQAEQYTAAALRRVGDNTSRRAGPDIIDGNFRRIGQQFDDLASRNSLAPDRQLAVDLGASAREYMAMVPESSRAPIIMDTIRDLGRTLTSGPLDGEAYQAVRSRIDRAARTSARDPQFQEALYGIRNALDDAMERTLQRTNPQDLGQWRQARRQYRNMLTVERAVTSAGEDAALGLVKPAALRNATVATQGRRNYARGSGDLAELARAGAATMAPLPNSGTASRLNARNIGFGLAGLAGAGAGTATGDPMNAVLGAAAGLAAPRLAGRVLMSETTQRYLANQLARNTHWTPQQRASALRAMGYGEAELAPSVGRALVGQ